MEEQTELDAGHHYLLDSLQESVSFVPSFLDDLYAELHPHEWWNDDQCSSDLPKMAEPVLSSFTTAAAGQEDSSKKRKQQNNEHEEGEVQRKKKQVGRGTGCGSGSGGGKDVRWAEQLLNPCAAAIEAGNLSRAQHLLYVLRELASPAGEPNHRLAAFGLRALASRLSTLGAAVPLLANLPVGSTISYASADPKLFRSALIRFHEISPWFALPNALANASIIQALDTVEGQARQQQRPIHIVDAGVSHGVQWPTLLEALTRRAAGPPPLVRLTVVAGSVALPPVPFSSSPVGYDFSVPLLRYAKSINLNLLIDHAEGFNFHAAGEPAGIMVVCLQFRAGQACSNGRSALLQAVRELDPDLVILSEMEWKSQGECARGFPRRAEMVWKFLESTAAAFKGRESAERAVVEGEAGQWLQEMGDAAEGASEWKERAAAAGLREEGFGEEALDAGKALLRKFDSSWEMRPASGGAVELRWKGQRVSFCSLWKPAATGTREEQRT